MLAPPPDYAAHIVPPEELRGRVGRFQARLRDAALDGALITHNSGLYYLAGTIQPASLYVPAVGEARLLVRRNEERISLESPWPRAPLRSFRALPELIAEGGEPPQRLGIEMDMMPVLTFRRYEKALPGVAWEDVGALLRRQRAVKTAWEIAQVRAVQPLAESMLAAVRTLLRPGITEVALAGALEAHARAQGHQGMLWLRAYNQSLYWGQLIAGESGTVGSYFDSPNGGWGLHPGKPDGSSLRVIEPGMPVLVDYCAARGAYMLDHTRTAVIGALPAELADAYAATIAVQDAVIAEARPGALGSDLYALALEVAAREGIADGFGGRGENQARFVGHGIGTEVDELPLLAPGWREPLEPGMLFALEPKFVHPTLGIVGIENTWLVTDSGVERLTSPDDGVIVVEA